MTSLIIFLPAVDPGVDEAGNLITGGMGLMLLWILMLNVLLNLPVDLFSSIAAFRIGRHMGMRSSWVAWIPGGNLWVLGCIADRYREELGRKGYLRWILPLQAVWAFVLWYCTSTQAPLAQELAALGDRYLLVPVLLSIGGIVAVYRALYFVYRCADLRDAAGFTAIGVIFSLPTPFLLLHAAKKFKTEIL